MLFSRPARSDRPSRSSLPARALPALVLGVSTLALAVSTSLPAGAAPHVPTHGAPEATTRSTPETRTTVHATGSAKRLTAAAERAGLEPGNATMGWRERGTERALTTSRSSAPRSLSRATSSTSFTPDGVLGIDIASYQRNIKWSTWTKRDKQFAYVKATEGTSYTNPYFTKQTSGADKAGVIRGAYHFASPNGKAGYKQARYFVKHGGGWSGDGETLPGVLDIEYNPYGSTCYGLSKKKMVAWAHSFTAEYYKLTGRQAVIYTTTDWWTRCTGNDTSFSENPLWIARYGTKKPGTLPKGWTTATMWQYTSNPIDQDVYFGSWKRFKKFAKKAS